MMDNNDPFKNDIVALFESFTMLVYSDGGDGTGTIMCRNWTVQQVADWYDEWNNQQSFKLQRVDRHDGTVSFWDNQEGIVFIPGPETTVDFQTRTEVDDGLKSLKTDYCFGNYILIL
jgi:hypothetical protein